MKLFSTICTHVGKQNFLKYNNSIKSHKFYRVSLKLKHTKQLYKTFKKHISNKDINDIEKEIDCIKEEKIIKNNSLSNFYDSMKLDQKESQLPVNIDPSINIDEFHPDRNLSTAENLALFKDHLNKQDYILKEKVNYKKRLGICLFIMFLGLFSLWIPLYKTICESQGFSVKTNHQDYKFDGRKCK